MSMPINKVATSVTANTINGKDTNQSIAYYTLIVDKV